MISLESIKRRIYCLHFQSHNSFKKRFVSGFPDHFLVILHFLLLIFSPLFITDLWHGICFFFFFNCCISYFSFPILYCCLLYSSFSHRHWSSFDSAFNFCQVREKASRYPFKQPLFMTFYYRDIIRRMKRINWDNQLHTWITHTFRILECFEQQLLQLKSIK